MSELPVLERTVDGIALFNGNVPESMHALGEQESPLVPISYRAFADRLYAFLVDENPTEERRGLYTKKSVGLGDGIRLNTDGSIKFNWDSPGLRNLTPESPLTADGLLPVDPQYFEHCDGPSFDAETAEKYAWVGHNYASELIDNPLFTEGLMRGNKGFATDLARALFDYAERIGLDIEGRFARAKELNVGTKKLGLGEICLPTPQEYTVECMLGAGTIGAKPDSFAGFFAREDLRYLQYVGGVEPGSAAPARIIVDPRTTAMNSEAPFIDTPAGTYALLAQKPGKPTSCRTTSTGATLISGCRSPRL